MGFSLTLSTLEGVLRPAHTSPCPTGLRGSCPFDDDARLAKSRAVPGGSEGRCLPKYIPRHTFFFPLQQRETGLLQKPDKCIHSGMTWRTVTAPGAGSLLSNASNSILPFPYRHPPPGTRDGGQKGADVQATCLLWIGRGLRLGALGRTSASTGWTTRCCHHCPSPSVLAALHLRGSHRRELLLGGSGLRQGPAAAAATAGLPGLKTLGRRGPATSR